MILLIKNILRNEETLDELDRRLKTISDNLLINDIKDRENKLLQLKNSPKAKAWVPDTLISIEKSEKVLLRFKDELENRYNKNQITNNKENNMETKSTVVYKSKHYDNFILIPNNRERQPDKTHYKLLVECMAKNGQLAPMICDYVGGQMLVADGQHRLLACQELNIPVKYIVLDGSSDWFDLLNGANRRSWTSEDRLRYHSLDGNKNYKRLSDLKKELGVSISVLHQMVYNKTMNTNDLASGLLEISKSEVDDILSIQDNLEEIKNIKDGKFKSVLSKGKPLSVLCQLLKHPQYNHEHFIKRLSRTKDLKPLSKGKQAVEILIGKIYNNYTRDNHTTHNDTIPIEYFKEYRNNV